MSPRSTRSPAAGWGSGTAGRAPTGRRPTARQSASSAPCSLAGPTVRSTAQATNGQRRLTAGSGTTTIDGDTQPSVTNPRSAEPTCSGLTSRRVWRENARQTLLAPPEGRRNDDVEPHQHDTLGPGALAVVDDD